jgi:hypothetical protein
MERTPLPTEAAHRSRGVILAVFGLILVTVALLAVAHPAQPGGPGARHLRPGDVVVRDGVSVVVPAPGETVWAEALAPDGGLPVMLAVASGLDGSVTVYRGEAAEDLLHARSSSVSAGSARVTAQSACSDTAYAAYSTRWTSTYKFRIKTSSFPSEVDKDATVSAIKAGAGNITGSDNDCGMGDQVGVAYNYEGSTDTGPNVNSSGGCSSRDSKNVAGFGSLPSTMLALTCWWGSGGSMIEADVRLNKASFLWVVNVGSGCSNKFQVEAVATHEFGHAFGLGHVSEATHGALTMSPTIYPCQRGETTLGRGDVLGLQSKY